MEDKWMRADALINGAQNNVDESIEDTLLDLANYAIMTVIEMRLKRGAEQPQQDLINIKGE
jgi:hypothetical protein